MNMSQVRPFTLLNLHTARFKPWSEVVFVSGIFFFLSIAIKFIVEIGNQFLKEQLSELFFFYE